MAACICRVGLVLLTASTLSAEIFSAGVRGGIPFGAQGYQNYTFGPTVEVKPPIVPIRFVVDALYKRIEAGAASGSVVDIPVMVRLETPTPFLRPFVMGGALFRRVNLFGGNTQTGFTLGGGLRITAPFVKITPEFRFSRVGENSFRGATNQGEFLIGITF